MKFRFQIVASAFHKGRLKITYDPSYPLSNEYNTNYTHIIDLAKEKDFTIDIGWGQERSMVGHRRPGIDNIPHKATAIGADPGLNGNGILSVYVVNDLTTPNATPNNDIFVNVFVSMGDDFEVFNPNCELIEDITYFEPQSGEKEYASILPATIGASAFITGAFAFLAGLRWRSSCQHDPQQVEMTPQSGEAEHPDADLTQAENEPMKIEASDSKAPSLSDQDQTGLVYYGDPVVSWRQCLKRYGYHRVETPETTGLQHFASYTPNFPLYRGYAPNGVHNCNVPVYPTPYNYVKTTLMNYVTPAYTARRGGLRWKYLRTGATNDDLFYVVRAAEIGVTPQIVSNTINDMSVTADTRVRNMIQAMRHTWSGTHATHVANNPVLEVELPWYENVRFETAKESQPGRTTGAALNQVHELCGTWNVATADLPYIHCFVAAAEDFTLAFFTGMPRAYIVAHDSEPTTL